MWLDVVIFVLIWTNSNILFVDRYHFQVSDDMCDVNAIMKILNHFSVLSSLFIDKHCIYWNSLQYFTSTIHCMYYQNMVHSYLMPSTCDLRFGHVSQLQTVRLTCICCWCGQQGLLQTGLLEVNREIICETAAITPSHLLTTKYSCTRNDQYHSVALRHGKWPTSYGIAVILTG